MSLDVVQGNKGEGLFLSRVLKLDRFKQLNIVFYRRNNTGPGVAGQTPSVILYYWESH